MLWGGRRADPAPQGTVSSSVTCQIPGAPKQKDGVHSRLVRWGAQINVCTPVCRDPRTISSLFLRLCLHVILVDVVLMLMTGSLQSRLGWMTNNPPPPDLFLLPRLKDYNYMLPHSTFLRGHRGLNSSPHADKASILPMELFLRPLLLSFDGSCIFHAWEYTECSLPCFLPM